jgi:uncharacterized membrane protein YcaP (DUF421 family)
MMVAEILGRVSLVYLALLAMMRIAGRREFSQMTPMDILVMLLVSRAVGDAMVGPHHGLAGGLVAAGCLFLVATAVTHVAYRWRAAERVVEGRADLLIRDGHVDARVLRHHRITEAILRQTLHEHGLERVEDVARAYVESDGVITMVSRVDVRDAREARAS